MRKSIYILFAFIFSFGCFSQGWKIAEVSGRCQRLERMSDRDSIVRESQQIVKEIDIVLPSVKPGEKNEWLKLQSMALEAAGNIYYDGGKPEKAIEAFGRALDNYRILEDKTRIAELSYEMGLSYTNEGNVLKALDHHSEAMRYFEQTGDSAGVAKALHSLGRIYKAQGEKEKCNECHFRALRIYESQNNSWGIALMNSEFGGTFLKNKQYDEAAVCFRKALAIYINRDMGNGVKGDTWGIANSLENLALVFMNKDQLDSAEVYLKRSLAIREATNYRIGQSLSNFNLGRLYAKKKDMSKAESYIEKSLSLAKENGSPAEVARSAFFLADLCEKKKDYARSLTLLRLYKSMNDSVNNLETRKAAMRSHLQYDYKRKERDMIVAQARNVIVMQESAKRKNLIIGFCIAGVFMMVLFMVVISNRVRLTRKQSRVIEEQKRTVLEKKEEVETKQREIMESIRYAGRIQRALIAGEKYIAVTLERMKGAGGSMLLFLLISTIPLFSQQQNIMSGYSRSENELQQSQIYEKTGNTKEGLAHYRRYLKLNDSIFNEEKTRNTLRAEMNFEFEQKEAKLKAERDERELLSAEENKRKNIVIVSVACVLLLMAVFMTSLINRMKLIRSQKRLIEEQTRLAEQQKELLEIRQAEIIESMKYARRIQRSLMPTELYLQRNLAGRGTA
jgi:tetratricopeptide (TPR) repeat protein